jgi:poly [ADP-ribose] polymerase
MPARTFKQLVIAVAGTFPNLKQGMSQSPLLPSGPGAPAFDYDLHNCILTSLLLLADLKSMIEKNGATFSTTVSDDCTHLVTTEKDVQKQTTKCECTITS